MGGEGHEVVGDVFEGEHEGVGELLADRRQQGRQGARVWRGAEVPSQQ